MDAFGMFRGLCLAAASAGVLDYVGPWVGEGFSTFFRGDCFFRLLHFLVSRRHDTLPLPPSTCALPHEGLRRPVRAGRVKTKACTTTTAQRQPAQPPTTTTNDNHHRYEIEKLIHSVMFSHAFIAQFGSSNLNPHLMDSRF